MRIQTLIGLAMLILASLGCGEESPKSETKRAKPPLFAKNKSAWLESHEVAVAKSKETGKPILALFTGSDWCRYCAIMDHNILTSPVFVKWAKENVVLLKLDFPKKEPLSPELQRQNDSLMSRYRVTGFPTVFLLDTNEEPIFRTGYQPGTAQDWVDDIDEKLKEHAQTKSEDTPDGE